ncbi:MAG: glycine cleavage system protein GcvH [Candidatus Caldarchaeales archaeon]|jgi:glycine cleavage system H protein
MSFEYEVPEGLLYSRNHEWLRVKGKIATVGVTDYVQRKLREVLYIELPNTNVKVVRGQHVATIESVRGSYEVRSPVSGKIVEVNARLVDSPELINEYPYESGWIFKVEISDEGELSDLMDADEYSRYLSELELETEESE